MNESTEHVSDCITVAEAWHLAWLYEREIVMAAYDSVRADLAEIAAGATVH